jgi:hypothetical protein
LIWRAKEKDVSEKRRSSGTGLVTIDFFSAKRSSLLWVFQKILAMKIYIVQNLVEWCARLLLSARVHKQKIVSLPAKKR